MILALRRHVPQAPSPAHEYRTLDPPSCHFAFQRLRVDRMARSRSKRWSFARSHSTWLSFFGIYNNPRDQRLQSEQTCSVPATAAFPTERHVSVFFLRRRRLLRYLNSVIFVMAFIHNCVLACGGDIWDIKGWARTNEENQQQ